MESLDKRESLVIAVATDDGKEFIDRHFGDAAYYYIYRLFPDSIEFLKRIENTTEEERMHADPVKAQGITGTLKKEKVQVAVSRIFGPNIKRIGKKFVCVLIRHGSIEESFALLQKQFSLLLNALNAGEERTSIKL